MLAQTSRHLGCFAERRPSFRIYTSTTQPTREMVEENMDFLEDVERGHGVYIILYQDGQPSEILFAGYSFD